MSPFSSDTICSTGTVPDGFGNCYPCSICTALSEPPSGCASCEFTTINNDVNTLEASRTVDFGLNDYTMSPSKVQEQAVAFVDGQIIWLAAILCILIVLTTIVIATMVTVRRNQRHLSRLSGRLIVESHSLYGDDEEKGLLQTWVDVNTVDNTTKTRISTNDLSSTTRDHTSNNGQREPGDRPLSGNESRYGSSGVDVDHDSRSYSCACTVGGRQCLSHHHTALNGGDTSQRVLSDSSSGSIFTSVRKNDGHIIK
ncbi:uncharacterized protein [Ptychodera flava]|uniref:uncharacterized protein n=1 Tax=Ptychodera flava TaxID=63121 RepID=UPI00396A5333